MPSNQPRLTSRRRRLEFFLLAAAVLLAGCSTGPGVSEAEVEAVATVAPIADLVRRVGGERVEVRDLIPPGEDSHTYQPKPSDARALAGAELFVDNGLGLNNNLLFFVEQNLPAGTPKVFLGEAASIPRQDLILEGACHGGDPGTKFFHCHSGTVNGHLWPNPPYASAYVGVIEDALIEIDPDGEDGYRENGDALRSQLETLDQAVQEAISTIPEENRKLVVYHDSWSYFARQYGMKVIGAIQPADFSEPSAAELKSMVEQIRAEGVPAFFGSEVFPSDVLETVARESGARYVADLSDDRLPGEPGDPAHSYIGMMVANARAITTALGGDPSPLDAVDPARG